MPRAWVWWCIERTQMYKLPFVTYAILHRAGSNYHIQQIFSLRLSASLTWRFNNRTNNNTSKEGRRRRKKRSGERLSSAAQKEFQAGLNRRLVYLVSKRATLTCMERDIQAHRSAAFAWCAWETTETTHKSDTHRNSIPISFLLEIIMLRQCSFDSRCNLYRYIIFCYIFSSFFHKKINVSCFRGCILVRCPIHGSPPLRHGESGSVQSDSFNRSATLPQSGTRHFLHK